ncbi:hypothetical protein [Photorhabdus aballayi]|uniref:hypothetical protein n=1 Tax=Photorhabdus aballayi TaxID=2991723 RepID=UPI00223E3D32|nr:hypothetical protein [Photorhabdus aballayi]
MASTSTVFLVKQCRVSRVRLGTKKGMKTGYLSVITMLLSAKRYLTSQIKNKLNFLKSFNGIQ